jgi:hypothetical protein
VVEAAHYSLGPASAGLRILGALVWRIVVERSRGFDIFLLQEHTLNFIRIFAIPQDFVDVIAPGKVQGILSRRVAGLKNMQISREKSVQSVVETSAILVVEPLRWECRSPTCPLRSRAPRRSVEEALAVVLHV